LPFEKPVLDTCWILPSLFNRRWSSSLAKYQNTDDLEFRIGSQTSPLASQLPLWHINPTSISPNKLLSTQIFTMPGRITAAQTRSEKEDAISSQSDQYSSSEEFEVEAILAEKTEDDRTRYLISWVGYPEEKSTWEAEKDISTDILDQWEETKKRQVENREEPFDVARFEARVSWLKPEKEHRRNGCNVKELLGMPIPESKSMPLLDPVFTSSDE
jgi:hypothetical protein